MTAGDEHRLVRHPLIHFCTAALVFLTALFASGGLEAQSLYKYQDANGEWVYTDRAPAEIKDVEIRQLPTGTASLDVSVTASLIGRTVHVVAVNELPIAVDLHLEIERLGNLEFPHPDLVMEWVVEAGRTLSLLDLDAIDDNIGPSLEFSYTWLPGDPTATHQDNYLYRSPFAVATSYRITQAYPIGITHLTPDSYYAVDFDMPVGTNVYAARDGVVFGVARDNFVGGDDAAQYLDAANVVRIMHDDGSHSVYAHLNWHSIRVRPGERVVRGQHIADSGNTGYSTGPHLHFAVLINRNSRLVSVPVEFAGVNGTPVIPETEATLAAY